MQGAHPNPETLQRYFDAELAANESADVRAHVASCEPCTAQLASLERLGTLVQMAAEDSAQQVDFDAMFANIERGIASTEQAPPKRDVMSQRVRRLSNAGPALGALALAAAVLLMVYRPDVSQTPSNEEPYEVTAGNVHSEVVEVDFGANAGTVFDILLSDGSSNPVVWIDDDETQDEPDTETGE